MRNTPGKSGIMRLKVCNTSTIISLVLLVALVTVVCVNYIHIAGSNQNSNSLSQINTSKEEKVDKIKSSPLGTSTFLSTEQIEHLKELKDKISEQNKELSALNQVKEKIKSQLEIKRQKELDSKQHQSQQDKSSSQVLQSDKTPSFVNKGYVKETQNLRVESDAVGKFQLPGAKGSGRHAILLLSDEEFRSTSVSQMLRLYGQAEGGNSCPGDFGAKLMDRWRETKQTVCQGADSLGTVSTETSLNPYTKVGFGETKRKQNANGGISSSTTECYLVRQTRHHGNGDNLCHYHDVSVNMAIFDDQNVVMPVVKNYVNTRHNKQPYIPFPKGFIAGKCLPLPTSGWVDSKMPGWNADLTTKSFASSPYSEDSGDDLHCDEWIDHKVIVLQRDTFANFFHDSEDFVNAFLALSILNWTPGDTQVYLTDLYPEGPFWEIWNEAFSWGKGKVSRDHSDSNNVFTNDRTLPVRTAFHLKQDFGTVTGKISRWKGKAPLHSEEGATSITKAPEHRVCFKDLAIGIYGPAAPITVASWATPCSNTALVRAYADFVIRGMNLQSFTHYAEPSPRKDVVITYMARRASTVWPEKRFCDDTKSFFLCKLWDKFGIRPLQRTIRNDDAVVQALRGMEKGIYANGAKVIFNDRDFNLLNIRDQIKEDLRTDILVGPHGAGLMHCVFLRDRAVVVELPIDGAGGNLHFHNLALWSGHKYVIGPDDNPVNIPLLVSVIKSQVESINLAAY